MSDGPFAVPLPAYRLGIHTARKRKRAQTGQSTTTTAAESASTRPSRTGSSASALRPSVAGLPPAFSLSSSPSPWSRGDLPSDSINPLSHSPDTLRQFAVAGLSPEDENPATLYPGFPHKGLPADAVYYLSQKSDEAAGDDDDKDGVLTAEHDDAGQDTEEESGTAVAAAGKSASRFVVQKHAARFRHIAVMTAIVHRCLGEGDIPRARRAFGLLMQTRDVDVKLNNFWLVGSEILMRQGETKKDVAQGMLVAGRRGRPGRRVDEDRDEDDDEEDEEDGKEQEAKVEHDDTDDDEAYHHREAQDTPGQEQQQEEERHHHNTRPTVVSISNNRWGRPENAEKVKSYFEHLIAQYPYDKNRPQLVSAVDFYPALYGLEVYNISAEFAAALERLDAEIRVTYAEYGDDDDDDSTTSSDSHSSGSDDEDSEKHHDEAEEQHDFSPTREFNHYNHHRGRRSKATPPQRFRWEATDEIRRQTQILAQQVAANMDRSMENNPYASHAELLRLRASLAIFVGDLYLPARIVEKVLRGLSRGRGSGVQKIHKKKDIMENLGKYLRGPEERIAVLDMRRQEHDKARELFRKVVAQGGVVEGWVEKFIDTGTGENDEDESA